MGYAPRPVLDPFIYNYDDYWKQLDVTTRFKLRAQGKSSNSEYWPVSQNPHFFSRNTAILRSLGFVQTAQNLAELIEPSCALFKPDHGEYDKEHFLQSAFVLSPQSHIFQYEISGRTHHVALLFCITPDEMHEVMKHKNRSSDLWMLDQAVISNNRGQSLHLHIDRDNESCTQPLKDLFAVLRSTNNLAEIGQYVDAHTVFTDNMNNLDEAYFTHHYEEQRKSPKTP